MGGQSVGNVQPVMEQETPIDLFEFGRLIWGGRKLILSVAFAVAVLTAAGSLLLPNIYRAEVLLAPAQSSDQNRSGGLSEFGTLASLAGVSLASGGDVEENLAVLESREFLWSFVKDEKLMPLLFADDWDEESKAWVESDPKDQPSLWDAYRKFTKGGVLSILADKNSGLVTVGVEWEEAEQAAEWANDLVARLNEYLRQQAIGRSQENLKYLREELGRTPVEDMRRVLISLSIQEQKKAMLASTQKQFAFQVIDKAVAPDRKERPKRAIMVVAAAFVAGLLAVIWVLGIDAYRKRSGEQSRLAG